MRFATVLGCLMMASCGATPSSAPHGEIEETLKYSLVEVASAPQHATRFTAACGGEVPVDAAIDDSSLFGWLPAEEAVL